MRAETFRRADITSAQSPEATVIVTSAGLSRALSKNAHSPPRTLKSIDQFLSGKTNLKSAFSGAILGFNIPHISCKRIRGSETIEKLSNGVPLRRNRQKTCAFFANDSLPRLSDMHMVSMRSHGMRPIFAKHSPADSNADKTLRTLTLPSSRMAKYADSPLVMSATYSKPSASAIILYVCDNASNTSSCLPEPTLIDTNFLSFFSNPVSLSILPFSESKRYPRTNGKHLSKKRFICALIE